MPAPPLQNFIDKVTVVVASWLNSVDRVVTTVFEQTATKSAARAALVNDLTAVSHGFEIVNGGTGAVDGLNLFFRGTDSGVVNSYVVTTTGLANPLLALNTGSILRVFVNNPNTGAATLAVNSFGPASIVDYLGQSLTGGELSGLQDLYWTGSSWQMRGPPVTAGYKRTSAEIAAGVVPVNYAYAPGNVLRYGADPSGSADSTSAIQAALNLANQNLNAPTYIPEGIYKYTQLLLKFTGTKIRGAGRGQTTLKPTGAAGAVGSPAVLTIVTNNLGVGGAYTGYITDLEISDLTFDYSNIPSSASNAVVYLRGSFNNVFRNIQFVAPTGAGTTTATWCFDFSRGVYTTTFDRVDGYALQLSSDTTDYVTTVDVKASSWTFVNINNALVITFSGATAIQGTNTQGYPVNKIQITAGYTITFVGCDFEGDATNNLFTIANSVGVLSLNNNLHSAGPSPMVWPGVYYTNSGGNAQIALQDNWAYQDETTSNTASFTGVGTPNYTQQSITWVRLGKRIHFTIRLTWTIASAGNTVVLGLPFPAASGAGLDTPVTVYSSGIFPGAGTTLQAIIPQGSSQVNVNTLNQTTGVVSAAAMAASGTLLITGEYVASTY